MMLLCWKLEFVMKILVFMFEVYTIIKDDEDYYISAGYGTVCIIFRLIKLNQQEVELFKKDHQEFFEYYWAELNPYFLSSRVISQDELIHKKISALEKNGTVIVQI